MNSAASFFRRRPSNRSPNASAWARSPGSAGVRRSGGSGIPRAECRELAPGHVRAEGKLQRCDPADGERRVNRLAAVMDAHRPRLLALGKLDQEIGLSGVAVLGHQSSDSVAASPSAGIAYNVQERRFDVGEGEGAIRGIARGP